MRSTPLLLLIGLPIIPLALAAGGPDSGGYVFETTDDPGGPPQALLDVDGEDLGLGDEESAAVALPFALDWYGATYDEITVGDNGTAFFSGDQSAAAASCAGGGGDWSGVAAYWDDLQVDQVRVAELGYYPNRLVLLDWLGLHPSGAAGDGRVQVWLQEASDEVVVVLDDVDFGDPAVDGGTGAVIGVQGGASDGLDWSCAGGLSSGSSAWFGPSGGRPDDETVDLGELELLRWGGSNFEYVGESLAGGDLNADGLSDLLIGAPDDGRVYLVYGGAAPETGALGGDAVFVGADSTDDLGRGLAMGDLDGDGLPEILLGEPENSAVASNAGAVHLFVGGAYGGTVATADADAVLLGPVADGRAGYSVAAPGDVDGDGYGDLLVGAPEDDQVDRKSGAVYLHYGGAGLSGALDLGADPSFLGQAGDSELGAAVAGGDIDGDGLADLLLGASDFDVVGGEGRAYLVPAGAWSGQWDVYDAAVATFTGEGTNDLLGSSLLIADLDGDDKGELILGAPRHDAGGVSRAGTVYVFPDGSSWSGDWGAVDATTRIDGDDRTEYVGTSLAAGDIDADGVNDLVIGGFDASLAAISGGGVWVFRSMPAGAVTVADADHVLRGQYTAGAAGAAVAALGDYTGDGYGDVAVGAPYSDVDGISGSGLVSVWDYHPSYQDEDGDGFVAWGSDGVDCDDGAAGVNPSAPESASPDGIWALDEDCDGWVDGAARIRIQDDLWRWDLGEFLGDPSPEVFDFEGAVAGDELSGIYLAQGISLVPNGALYADGDVYGSPASGALAASLHADTANSLRIDFEEGVDALAFQLMDGEDPLALDAWGLDGASLLGGYVRVEHDGNDLPGGRFVGLSFSEPVLGIELLSTGAAGWGVDDLQIAWSRGSDRDGDGYTPSTGDCDDTDAAVGPGAVEDLANGVDDDCDGVIDGGGADALGDSAAVEAVVPTVLEQVDFEDFAPGTVIDDEYASLGLLVDGTLQVATDIDGAIPDQYQAGLATARTVVLSFDEVQPAVGFQLLDAQGTFTLYGYADGVQLYGNTLTLFDDNGEAGTFRGFVYDYGVDTLEIVGPLGDTWGLDDVIFSSLGLDDADGDGLSEPEDCDDHDGAVHPGAEEIWYDGVDQDCAGDSDYDADGDGADLEIDCDDESDDVSPYAAEIWYDGIDGDCNGLSDYDADMDGHDDAAYGGDDCDDTTDLVSPDVAEVFYDGIDQNCEPTDDNDADGDGYSGGGFADGASGGGDCDDQLAETYPGAPDAWYDGVDSDCDAASDYDADGDGFDSALAGGTDPALIDCDDRDGGVFPGAEDDWYDGLDQDCAGDSDYDADGDGYDADTYGGEDCDDTDPAISPDAVESSDTDGLDENCDGVDEWDADGDGYRDQARGGEDCDDGDPAIYPDAPETCYDGIDSNCSGHSDQDCDEDGHERALTGGDDCDDRDAEVHPGAAEICFDALDSDCDGAPDLSDCDGDGFDSLDAGGDDCDDADPGVSPGATDYPYDGVDSDCGGGDDYDADGDGHQVDFYGGDDCDDGDAAIYPGAVEIWYDGADGDCAGDSDYDADGDSYEAVDYGGEDCADGDAAIYPGASDTWYDGVDGDCAGDSDYDADGDGRDWDAYGGEDCDDADPTAYAGAPDTWYDGIDADCAGDDDYDADGDGYDRGADGGLDCDDGDPEIRPSAVEIWYDGVDQDCSGGSDYDADGDGAEVGGGDCADDDPAIGPGAEEICDDGIDQDCDGTDRACEAGGADTGGAARDTADIDTGGADTAGYDTGGVTGGETGGASGDTGDGGSGDTGGVAPENIVTGLSTAQPAGCGCASGAGASGTSAAWSLGLLLLGWRRRRKA